MDPTGVGLAPTTGKTRTGIYDLGFTITKILPGGNALKIGCGQLRTPICGNTIFTNFTL